MDWLAQSENEANYKKTLVGRRGWIHIPDVASETSATIDCNNKLNSWRVSMAARQKMSVG